MIVVPNPYNGKEYYIGLPEALALSRQKDIEKRLGLRLQFLYCKGTDSGHLTWSGNLTPIGCEAIGMTPWEIRESFRTGKYIALNQNNHSPVTDWNDVEDHVERVKQKDEYNGPY